MPVRRSCSKAALALEISALVSWSDGIPQCGTQRTLEPECRRDSLIMDSSMAVRLSCFDDPAVFRVKVSNTLFASTTAAAS